jgi:hypothetical protein
MTPIDANFSFIFNHGWTRISGGIEQKETEETKKTGNKAFTRIGFQARHQIDARILLFAIAKCGAPIDANFFKSPPLRISAFFILTSAFDGFMAGI